jgi:hypothetical protein
MFFSRDIMDAPALIVSSSAVREALWSKQKVCDVNSDRK